MTSRFSKTYSRKGGEANSKFEEVFANRKATLSTKWGETTYKAQLGSKRLSHSPSTPDILKKPRSLDHDNSSEDPFSFDSDDELSSTSKKEETCETDQQLEGEGNTVNLVQSSSASVRNRENISPVNSTPLRRVLVDNSVNHTEKDFPPEPGTEAPAQESKPPEQEVGEAKLAEQPVEFELLPLIKSASDRVYRRAKHKSEPENSQNSTSPVVSAETSSSSFAASPISAPVRLPLSLTGAGVTGAGVTGVAGAGVKASEVKGRGRVRDYTVLLPSCVSVCNVTIQDSMERGVEECVSTTPTDLGDTGTFHRRTDPQPPKYSRFRPTKSKLECKLEFFGFEDGVCEGEESEPGTSYKIKYFGFDELSDSEEEEETSGKKKKKMMMKHDAVQIQTGSVDNSQNLIYTDQEWQAETNSAGSDSQKDQTTKQSDQVKESSRKMIKKSHAKAVYNARHWNQPEPEEPAPTSLTTTVPKLSVSSVNKEASSLKDDGVFKAPPPPPDVPKSVTKPTETRQDSTTGHKELYTVVQQVKHFNDVVEFGENQEFTDDFEYLETGLKSTQHLHTRCLSIISLASRCAMPSFRMHLRARGKVAQVFKMLSDAPQHPNLALCTAALLYILSRDRLNMDLDRACLELMIRLLELEQDDSVNHDNNVKEKIQKLCETVHNKHLDLHNITTGHLAMETLLSLTSKRAGDWFKEELRLLGGLDHIIDKVRECVENLNKGEEKENLVASLWGAERCLRVLESVTFHNPENQTYLIAYKDSQLIVSSAKALRHSESMIQLHYSISSGSAPTSGNHGSMSKAVENCMRAVLGVMLNLTHENEWGSTKTGEQDGLMMTLLNCVLKVPHFLPQDQRFDIRVLGLGLLINLVEYSSRNRQVLVEMEVDSDLLQSEKDEKVKVEKVAQMEKVEPIKSEMEDGEQMKVMEKVEETDGEVKREKQEENIQKIKTEMKVEVPDEETNSLNTKGTLKALGALVQLFLERERAAVLAEAQADDIISEAPKSQTDESGRWQVTSGEMQWVASENNNTDEKEKEKEEEEEELDFNKVLQHAGKHMEDSIVASYTALLLGCLCQDSPINVNAVRQCLPEGNFSIMTEMLKRFLNFMNLTCAVGTTGQKSISRVIDYLEHC
ncbi:wings apart-like protein homolog [Trichomycterus rosablanca]|uniref:wings apart-like protein homolog n=1 Tax=Trichomycterus rosablanca TaxID=2290929 RepID=UPI002F360DBE